MKGIVTNIDNKPAMGLIGITVRTFHDIIKSEVISGETSRDYHGFYLYDEKDNPFHVYTEKEMAMRYLNDRIKDYEQAIDRLATD